MTMNKEDLVETITELFKNSTLAIQTVGANLSESKLNLETVFVELEDAEGVSTYDLLNTMAEVGASNVINQMVDDMIADAEQNTEDAEFTEVPEEDEE